MFASVRQLAWTAADHLLQQHAPVAYKSVKHCHNSLQELNAILASPPPPPPQPHTTPRDTIRIVELDEHDNELRGTAAVYHRQADGTVEQLS